MSGEQLEAARVHMSRMSPVSDAITSCQRLIDEKTLPGVLDRLCEMLRGGVGLPTLVACSSMVTHLASGPYAGAVGDLISPVLQSLVRGLSDGSPTVRKSYCTAIGYCCRIASRSAQTSFRDPRC